jgi:acetyl esterase/lipase
MAQAFPPKGEAHESAEVGVPLSWKKLWFAPEIPAAAVESLVYATRENRALRLFYSHDAAVPMAPCVIMIHGGGWESGTPREFPKFSDHLVQHGYAVADIEYRFAPRWPWPAQREDVLDAITCLKTHAAQLHLDPQRFVLLGRSAGGQIAEAVAYGAGRSEIRGCIAFYAPADMHYAYEFARADDILNSLRLVRQYLGGTPTEVRDNYDSASGILLASHDSPPTLLIHGRRDELVWFRQSQRLSNRLDALGVPHCFVQLPWATHAFDYNFNGPGGQISTYAVDTFLGSVLR